MSVAQQQQQQQLFILVNSKRHSSSLPQPPFPITFKIQGSAASPSRSLSAAPGTGQREIQGHPLAQTTYSHYPGNPAGMPETNTEPLSRPQWATRTLTLSPLGKKHSLKTLKRRQTQKDDAVQECLDALTRVFGEMHWPAWVSLFLWRTDEESLPHIQLPECLFVLVAVIQMSPVVKSRSIRSGCPIKIFDEQWVSSINDSKCVSGAQRFSATSQSDDLRGFEQCDKFSERKVAFLVNFRFTAGIVAFQAFQTFIILKLNSFCFNKFG